MLWQLAALLIWLAFYGIYLGKMLVQRKQGIRTDQIARGKEKGKRFYTELFMKLATYSVAAAEVISIALRTTAFPAVVRGAGIVLGAGGVILFALAVRTMRDSWRAGIAEKEKTEMVTEGIYRFSRNPAFMGFDLVYLGILLLFFNWALLLLSLFAGVMLHLQILQEEAWLPVAFGERYLKYRQEVCRYLGRRSRYKEKA